MTFISVPETEIANDIEKLYETSTVAEWGADKLRFKTIDIFQAFCKLAGLKAEECVAECYVGFGTYDGKMKCYTWRNEARTCFLSLSSNPLCGPQRGEYAGYLGVTAERELALNLKHFVIEHCCIEYEDVSDGREYI